MQTSQVRGGRGDASRVCRSSQHPCNRNLAFSAAASAKRISLLHARVAELEAALDDACACARLLGAEGGWADACTEIAAPSSIAFVYPLIYRNFAAAAARQEATDALTAARSAAAAAEGERDEALTSAAGCISAADARALRDKARALEEEVRLCARLRALLVRLLPPLAPPAFLQVGALTREVTKARGVADIASDQVRRGVKMCG
jgi:hypothetical protein